MMPMAQHSVTASPDPLQYCEIHFTVSKSNTGDDLALQVAGFLKLRAAGTTGRIATLHVPAAGLLAITAVSMAVFRFL